MDACAQAVVAAEAAEMEASEASNKAKKAAAYCQANLSPKGLATKRAASAAAEENEQRPQRQKAVSVRGNGSSVTGGV